jgi:hypothetical protein
MKILLANIAGVMLAIILVLAAIGYLTLTNPDNRVSAETHNEALSEASHLRNLNWLLARQIEREKGGEQLNPSRP